MQKIKSINNLRLLLIIIVFSITSPIFSYSQTDSIFWFAAPELQQNHGDRPILLRLSSTGSAAVINISLPSNASFIPI